MHTQQNLYFFHNLDSSSIKIVCYVRCGVGQEGKSPGEKGRESGEERAGECESKGGGNREKLRNILQHFIIFCNRNGTKKRKPLTETGRKWEHMKKVWEAGG